MLANSNKNRNIKANDVNLISMARNTDFWFKTTYVCFCASDQCLLSMFCMWFVTFWKSIKFPHESPPPPFGAFCRWPPPPPPRNFQWSSVRGGGGGMDIIWNYTLPFKFISLQLLHSQGGVFCHHWHYQGHHPPFVDSVWYSHQMFSCQFYGDCLKKKKRSNNCVR